MAHLSDHPLRRGAAAVFLLTSLASRDALAGAPDEPPAATGAAAPQPVVVPPRLVTDPGVKYPDQALKERFFAEVTVVLILEIDASGAVRKATVEAPQGHGFDEAAVAAAEKLVFEPARRNDKNIPARIKFRYAFVPPPPKLTGRVEHQTAGSPIAPASITVRTADGAEHTTQTAADGSWTLENVMGGPTHIVVSAPGYEPQSADEELTPGEETHVVLRLLPRKAPAENGAASESEDEPPVQEIVVRGERPPREVTKRTLKREEIALIPGTNGDALRSLQNLPGVARPPPFGGQLIVRGSAPQDTTTYVDGTPVPIVYHFGGLSSVVPTEALDKINFYPSNYSAMYGRGMGGMVDVGIRDPKKDGRLHGMAQLDLIDARLLVEGTIPKTGVTFLIAGRRSWFDGWLGPVLTAAGAGVSTAPRYYDYQVMLKKDFGQKASLRLLFFGSDDGLEIFNENPNAGATSFSGIGTHTSFWRLQARYEHKLTDSTELKVTAAVGQDSVDIGFGALGFTTTELPISGRAEVSQKVMRSVRANVGIDMIYSPYDLHIRFPRPRPPGVPAGGPEDVPLETTQSGKRLFGGMYTEWEIMPWRGMRIVPGLRLDYTSSTQSWDISPRLNLRQELTSGSPRTALKAGAGIFYQPPGPLETDPVFGQEGLKSNRSIHYDVGFEQEFGPRVELSVNAFYKQLDRLVSDGAGNAGAGAVYGTEWLLRYKSDERFFGWIAYTLSRSERRPEPTEPSALSQYDQTHVLTTIASYNFGRGYRLGARFRLVSGNPYTPTTRGAYDATTGSFQAATASPPYGARLPLFHQLDVRFDKTWTFDSWKLSAYIDIQNVYNHQNPEGITYNYDYTQSSYVSGLPILPSLGLRGEL
ncbi:TonB family protein [Polyangium sp. y55x31]|uniref:TonB family protein n=1 Tax=Polyangium sp. y55x31 TaxID=3042688 RepID=UPI0024822786|nr:TonB family protein [Polyangium sp. y55x31]MDI1479218.1 TonB family protein [Polyangium sp. y55x31]